MTQSTNKPILILAVVVILIVSGRLLWSLQNFPKDTYDPETGTGRIAVVFSGGHEINPVDRGRPVILIAGALDVPPEIFRKAFSNVRPAPAGSRPTHERARQNKDVLMHVLSPHGITNDRLDDVSNYYRYNRSRGEMWHTKPATAYAIIEKGVITGFEVTSGGSGYSSPPTVTVRGFESDNVKVQLSFGKQFEKNGSVTSLTIQ